MKIKLFILGILFLVLILLLINLAACTPSPEEPASPLIEVTDQLGRTVKLDKIPQRIISLAPGNTEILYTLGLADKLVAVTNYCDYPLEAKEKPSIGGFSTPNLEEIVNHSPDLVLATSIHESEIIPSLENRGITVFALDAKTLDEVLAAITLVGKITAQEKEATQIITEMQTRIKAVTDKTEKLLQEQQPRVFYVVWHDPLMTAGLETTHDELISKAGGLNIASALSGYANIDLEVIIEANPEVMIASTTSGSSEDQIFQFLKNEPRLKDTDASKNDRIYLTDGNLVSRDGPRLVDGLELFAKIIHPELFK